jgi:hypothetical protein
MKYSFLSILIAFSLLLVSCEKENEKTPESQTSEVNLHKSNSDFVNVMSNRSEDNSDPFELISIVFENGNVNITVAYSGGCKTHTFTVIWDEVITNSNPPGINLIITHDANGDACEAYITETLVFPLTTLIDNFLADEKLNVGAFNGWNPEDSTEYEGTAFEFKFTESDECVVNVTAREVICGNGLYDNLWFALDDSTSSGMPGYYFYNYLQPVVIDASLSGFKPVQGKKYTIGARISNENPFMNEPVCLAYSGPSIPVKIMCIKEIK